MQLTTRGVFALAALIWLMLQPSLRAETQSIRHQTVDVNSGWQFLQAGTGLETQSADWLPAQVPGDVHLDLLRNKLIPPPFYRDDEQKLQWIQDAGWEYRSTIHVTQELLQHQNVELVFEGLDTVAEVSLNGHKLLSTDNMFREWRVDAKPYLHQGDNQLLVAFPSATKAADAAAATDKWRAETQTAARTYVRKAAYEYGWDWGPTFVTSGIWKPVKLEAWDKARISNLYIRQADVSASVAHLTAELEITASVSSTATVALDMLTPEGRKTRMSQRLTLGTGINHVVFPLEIANPALWYPAGYGAHPIYHFHATASDGATVLDETTAETGLRSIELRRTVDQWGRSFEFVVNGIPVFAKGADVIPFDSFPNRVTGEQMHHILQSAIDANMNMVRVWGGGYYETDEFYGLCDELGLMVWQDFMFGNDWQPGTYAFKQNVAQEIEYQVRRLRNHPSIVLWCGNNETEISWDWDRMKAITEHLSAETRRHMWQDYLTLFSGVIPHVVKRLNPETPYWPSSPSADYEDVSDAYQSGDMHDWSVWHGRAPFHVYEEHFPRFMSEYGFQSFPEMQTIKAFSQPEDRGSIFTPVMLGHQKNDEGNSIIHDYMLRYYGEPKDFSSFLYASQVLQAEGVKVGAEHLRRMRPRSMGSLYWQLNDCWPVASWSSIDYYGRWKALQYYARRFYSPVLVSPALEDGSLAIYVVSDQTKAVDATLHLRIMSFNGDIVQAKDDQINIDPLASKAYLKIPMEKIEGPGVDLAHIFVAVDIEANGHSLSKNILYFVPTAQISLPHPEIHPELVKAGEDYRLRLTSKVLARSVYVEFGDYQATFSDNYLDLLPNEPVEITIHSAATLEQLRDRLKFIALTDAFSSKATNATPTAVPANPDWK
jgi:beta-mannosidase